MTSDTDKARQRELRKFQACERRKDEAADRVVRLLDEDAPSLGAFRAAQEVHADLRADWVRQGRKCLALGAEVEVPEY